MGFRAPLQNTGCLNLTGDYYTYQIQVTNNDGATALDTVNVIPKRLSNHFENCITMS
jgi:hypothetical protein